MVIKTTYCFSSWKNHIISTKRKVCIMTKPHLMYLDSVLPGQKGLMNLFEISISIPKKRKLPGFKHFLEALTPSQYPDDLYFHKSWIDNFYCSPPPLLCGNHKACPLNLFLKTKQEKIVVIITSESSFSIWNTEYALAHGIHKVIWRNTEIGTHEVAIKNILLHWQISLPHKQKESYKLIWGQKHKIFPAYN